MRRWSETAERVAATSKTSEKRRILAAYLRELPPDDLATAAVFFTGRPFPETDQRPAGIGWASIATAVESVTGADRAALGAAYDRTSDLGDAVAIVVAERGRSAEDAGGLADTVGPPDAGPSLAEVTATFDAIRRASGPSRKADILAGLLRRCDASTARFIVRILSGDLRIGVRAGALEAATADAFGRPLAAVSRAHMLTGDVGVTAELARDDRLAEAALAPLRPLGFMLASPVEDAAEILRRLGPVVWVEDKYDGIRAQLHRVGDEVRLFSRDLNDVTTQFPEIAAAATGLGWDGILDGEVLAYRDGRVLPFLRLQARLGRKAPSAEVLREIPVVYVAFDALALGPRGGRVVPGGRGERVEPLLDVPLAERRRRLEALGLTDADRGGRFVLSRLVTADSAEALERAFLEARARRNEGLVVKDPGSRYTPGRRGFGWLKMKKALATIDCVVVGVEVGHGKRHGVLSDYTFAVRDETNGRLVTIGKAYSGLTDAELAEMTAWFEAHTLSIHGRYRVVEPTVVIEVAFDVIQRSRRHRSGFSLRFPRIARLRLDKAARETDTLATVESLFTGMEHGT
jgi:DNA ligase-1